MTSYEPICTSISSSDMQYMRNRIDRLTNEIERLTKERDEARQAARTIVVGCTVGQRIWFYEMYPWLEETT